MLKSIDDRYYTYKACLDTNYLVLSSCSLAAACEPIHHTLNTISVQSTDNVDTAR